MNALSITERKGWFLKESCMHANMVHQYRGTYQVLDQIDTSEELASVSATPLQMAPLGEL